MRQASVLIADEIYYNLHGKAILQGVYHNDLTINASSTVTPQLLFFFMAETDVNDPFRSLIAQITFPKGIPLQFPIPIQYPTPIDAPAGRTKISVRWPVLITSPILFPGKIEVKLIHESGEIIVTAPWIVLIAPPPRNN